MDAEAAHAYDSPVRGSCRAGVEVTGLSPAGKRELRPMLIRLSDHALVDELCDHYRRSGFVAEPVRDGVVEALRTDAPSREQCRREVLMHLQVWRVLNPDAAVQTLV